MDQIARRLEQEIIQSIEIGGRNLKYYYHNRRPNAAVGILKILEEGFSVVNAEPFNVCPPLNWGEEIPNNAEWTVIRNAFFSVDYLLQAYIDGGNNEYLILAADTCVDWVDYNIEQAKPNRYKWSDICTGLRLYYFSFVLQELSVSKIDYDRSHKIIFGALTHIDQLMVEVNISKANHAFFQVLGMASLATVMPFWGQSRTWIERAKTIFLNVLILQYGKEGIHLEHSPYYHGWVWSRLKQIAGFEPFSSNVDIKQLMERIESNYIHFFHPDGSLAELGESSGANIFWMKEMAPSFLWATSKGQNGRAPENTDMVFQEAGYAMMRDSFEQGMGKSLLIAAAGCHSISHKQNDNFTFELSEFGKKLIVDTGKHSYDKNEERYYADSRRAHNVVEVVGDSDSFLTTVGADTIKNSIFQNYKMLFLDSRQTGVGQSAKRYLVVVHGVFLLVVDQIEWNVDACFKQWFHLAPDLVYNEAHKCFEAGENNLRFQNLMDDADYVVHMGENEPEIQGWYCPSYGQLAPNVALNYEKHGCNVCFATLITYRKKSATVECFEQSDLHFQVAFTLYGRQYAFEIDKVKGNLAQL